jgi:hypothetical protein
MALINIDFSQFLGDLLSALLYPLQVIIEHLRIILDTVVSAFYGLIVSFLAFFDAVYFLISGVITSWFPSMWLIPIFLMLSIVFLLRLYWFLKDVSILGNKV